MRAVVQRVSSAFVTVDGEETGRIGLGLAVLLGIETGDTETDLNYICDKLLGLRVFDDENEVPNCSVTDVGGSILLVSQFTLCGDARHGRRPSYIAAARPEAARPLYQKGIERLSRAVPVETGRFQAHMRVSITNDGPFTILLDSRRCF